MKVRFDYKQNNCSDSTQFSLVCWCRSSTMTAIQSHAMEPALPPRQSSRTKPAAPDATQRKTERTAKAKRLQPRRTPNQARSRDTLELVLRAAGAVIGRDGLDRLTTRKIAEEAGISVGALYEYF